MALALVVVGIVLLFMLPWVGVPIGIVGLLLLTAYLLGEDAFAVERCWQLARPATFDILRDRRLGLVAGACIDTAIWDLIGKALGQPLWRLWGGYTNRLPTMSIGGYYGGGIDIEDEI